MQPREHSPGLELFTTRRVAVVEGERGAAEMLHTFFRLMELDCSVVLPDSDAVSKLRRQLPDILIVSLDPPDLRALEIARELRNVRAQLPIILLTDGEPSQADAIAGAVVMPRPHGAFEDLLRLFEAVLAMGGGRAQGAEGR